MTEGSNGKPLHIKSLMDVLESCLGQCKEKEDWAGQAFVCTRLGTMHVDMLPNGRLGKEPSFGIINSADGSEEVVALGQVCQCSLSEIQDLAQHWFSKALEAAERHLAQRNHAHASEIGKERTLSSTQTCRCSSCVGTWGSVTGVLRTKANAFLHLARLRYMSYVILPV